MQPELHEGGNGERGMAHEGACTKSADKGQEAVLELAKGI